MKETKRFRVTYKELAKMFYVNTTQIANWIRSDKFKAHDLYSVGLFFTTQIVDTIDRKLEWDDLLRRYKSRQTTKDENFTVEGRLKDWSLEGVRTGMWK